MAHASEFDIVIIGAGIIGSGLAMALAEKGAKNVAVIDPDLEGTFSSSELNAGGVRATFHQEINVVSSKISIEYFAKHRHEVGFREVGYLWLHTPESFKKALIQKEKWGRLGWDVEAWSVDQLRKERPFIDQTDDLGGAIFSPQDGLINTNLLKLHYRSHAKNKGVQFLDRLSLEHATYADSRWNLKLSQYPLQWSEGSKNEFFAGSVSSHSTASVTLRAKRIVNCGGAWAKKVAKTLGYDLPTFASRRQISFFDTRDADLSTYGMIIDTSGVYFHPEATKILGGFNLSTESHGFNFEYSGEDFFQEYIWAPLSQRSSKFEKLRHISGWAGLYEVSPDESAIVGEVTEVGVPARSLYESHSYSGHGVMHSYANGQALAEKILNHQYASDLDLTLLEGGRFKKNQLIHESAVI
jgi:sarcosine oxidase subunit beta